MNLFANGDSFTYGYELSNRKDSYPYILGNLLKTENVYNLGICSGSNEYIFRTTMDFILEHSNDPNYLENLLVVIGWSSDIRWEGFLDEYNIFVQLKLGREMRIVDEKDCSIIRNEALTNVMSKTKLKVYNNISEDFLSNFKKSVIYNNAMKYYSIFSLHNILLNYNIKHIFFNSLTEYSKINRKFNMPKSTEILSRKNLINNVKLIKEKLIIDKCWIPDTMEEFCSPYPKGSFENHPLEEGHIEWGKHLFNFIEKVRLF